MNISNKYWILLLGLWIKVSINLRRTKYIKKKFLLWRGEEEVIVSLISELLFVIKGEMQWFVRMFNTWMVFYLLYVYIHVAYILN